jgi:hypothetical protein
MRTRPLALALVAVSGLLLIGIIAVAGWWALLRIGLGDKLICLDAQSKTATGVYRTYEADSGCASEEICVELEAGVRADHLRATDCRGDYAD